MNKQNKLFTIGAIALLIAVAVFGFASCDDGNGKSGSIQRNYTITLLGTAVTVTDTRTGEDDQSLKELGIIAKLEGAVILLNSSEDILNTNAYNKVLGDGTTIIVEKPVVAYDTYKTKSDGKTMMFDIDNISDDEVTSLTLATRIDSAVENYLSKGLELK